MQSPVPTSWLRNARGYKITTAQPCANGRFFVACPAALCQTTGGKARLTEDASSEGGNTKAPQIGMSGSHPINTFWIKKNKGGEDSEPSLAYLNQRSRVELPWAPWLNPSSVCV